MGLLAAIHRRVVSRSWLIRSVWPLDSGWNPNDRLAVAPTILQKAPQNRDENWGLRSETISRGIPNTRKTWFMISSAVSLAEGNLGRGINRAAFENQSTTTRMTVLPWEGGSPVTKSRERCDHGLWGMGKGCNSP